MPDPNSITTSTPHAQTTAVRCPTTLKAGEQPPCSAAQGLKSAEFLRSLAFSVDDDAEADAEAGAEIDFAVGLCGSYEAEAVDLGESGTRSRSSQGERRVDVLIALSMVSLQQPGRWAVGCRGLRLL